MNSKIATAFLSFGFLFSALLAYCSSAEQLKVKKSGFYGPQKISRGKTAPPQGKEEVSAFISHNPRFRKIIGGDFKISIGSFETVWSLEPDNYDKDKSGKAIIRMRIGGLRPLEFCEVPPEITDFDKIGDLAKYKYNRLATMFFTNVGCNPHSRKEGSFPANLRQGEIIILRDDEKCIAIKTIGFRPVYGSPEEVPDFYGQQPGLARNSYKKDYEKYGLIPLWKSMTYEWKLLSSATSYHNTASAENYEVNQGISSAYFDTIDFTTVKEFKEHRIFAAGGRKEYFYIPGIDFSVRFSFTKSFEGEKLGYYLSLYYDVRLSLVEKAWMASLSRSEIDEIKDPSSYEFKAISNGIQYGLEDIGGGLGTRLYENSSNMLVILRIDNKYVAIRPLRIENDQVVYEWKYWPNTTRPSELAKTALNK